VPHPPTPPHPTTPKPQSPIPILINIILN